MLLITLTHNQKVPYKSIIDGGLRSGKVIIIEGVINPDGFDNNNNTPSVWNNLFESWPLPSDQKNSKDVISSPFSRMEIFLRHKTGIGFYYSPHFDENVVVCNSYEDGTWGEEEIYELMPIEIGQPLQVSKHLTLWYLKEPLIFKWTVWMTVNTMTIQINWGKICKVCSTEWF